MIELNRRQILKTSLAAAAAAMPGATRAASGKLKIGHITAITGAQASFGVTERWMVEKILKATGGKIRSGGTEYEIEIVVRDTQSNPNRLASVGQELILREGVDLLLIQDGNAAIAVGELAERFGVPTISTMTPWQAWMYPRRSTPEKGFQWTYHFFWGAGDAMSTFVRLWDSVATNKRAGDFYLDNSTGHAFADPQHGLPQFLAQGGYGRTEGGMFAVEADDFSSQVAGFKAAEVDIITGFGFPQHWATFWNQAGQAGLKPKICTFAGAFLFPDGITALGDRGDGMTTEVWWTPKVPFSSSITGQTAEDLANLWQDETGGQWVQLLGYSHALFEAAIHALQQSGDPKNKAAVRDAIANMDMKSMVGPIKFAGSPIRSVAVTQLAGGQWRKSQGGKYPFDLLITENKLAPDITPEAPTVSLAEI